MPTVSGKYVAPTWVDGGAPALDAAELQAICDAIVRGEADVVSLATLVAAKAKVEIGSYVGTGTSGSSNKSSLTFSFSPKIVIIEKLDTAVTYSFALFLKETKGVTIGNSASGGSTHQQEGLNATWSGNTLTWCHTSSYYGSPGGQMNAQNETYYYIAIG